MKYNYQHGVQKTDYKRIICNVIYVTTAILGVLVVWDLFFNYGRNFINIMFTISERLL